MRADTINKAFWWRGFTGNLLKIKYYELLSSFSDIENSHACQFSSNFKVDTQRAPMEGGYCIMRQKSQTESRISHLQWLAYTLGAIYDGFVIYCLILFQPPHSATVSHPWHWSLKHPTLEGSTVSSVNWIKGLTLKLQNWRVRILNGDPKAFCSFYAMQLSWWVGG